MAKQPMAPASADTPEPVPAAPKITIAEFCVRQSEKMTRPELLGGFEFVEKRAGRLKDTEAAYLDRFIAFQNTPV